MLVNVFRNYGNGEPKRTYEVPEDFVEEVCGFALIPARRPEWWLAWVENGKEKFLGFDMDPTWYYGFIKRVTK
jgi:hypothetical protein